SRVAPGRPRDLGQPRDDASRPQFRRDARARSAPRHDPRRRLDARPGGLNTGKAKMAKIPKVLHEHIDTAFPANVCLLASVLPNGFAQVTPRGGTMAYDDEHIGLWGG